LTPEDLKELETLVERFEAEVAADAPCRLACMVMRLHIRNELETAEL